jgi:tetratricopeptide (TPR) repeat protein
VPFEGETPFSIAFKHKSETPRNPKEVNAQIPEDLSRVILRCLEKDKELRYQSAGEVRSELIRIEKGIPTTEREIPKRKPITSREITVTFGLRKLFIPALVAIALAIAGIIIWRFLPRQAALPIPSDKPSLAVMYFENNTGDESLDHWRKALSDLLIADLSQSKLIRVLSRDRLFNILSELNQIDAKSYSSKVLNEVAIRGGVNHLLQGAYAKAGDNIRINVMLQDTSTGELIGSEGVEGKGEESIFSMVDELTMKIKTNFRLSPDEIASDIDKQVGKITTSSPEAYKYYSDGKKYYDMGDNRKAIQFFERAVAIDPEFAIAYMDMAVAYFNLRYDSEEKKYLQKAFELRGQVSDRERYQIEAEFYAESEKTFDKSIEAFNKLLELYPDDLLGNKDLGWLYTTIEQWDKATERFKVCIQNNDTDITTYTNQAASYRANGLYDKAQEILEYYLSNFSDNAAIHWDLSYNYLCQAKYDLALIEVDKALSLAPTDLSSLAIKGDIYLYKGDLIKAEQEYQKLLDSEESTVHMLCRISLGILYMLQGKFEESKIQIKQGIELTKKLGEKESESFFHLKLAYLYLKSGNPEKALKECNKSWSSAVEAGSLRFKKFALHSKGLALIEMKLKDEAQRTADELKDEVQKGLNKKEIRLYYHLLGMLELQKENSAKAIEYFEETISLLPHHSYGPFDMHALFIDSLALGYYKAGNLEKAEEEYKKISALTTGRLHYGGIYAKSFYMLGKIFEQKDWKGKAIEHYQKFLDLWKDADPGFPEVEEAKKRLASLQKK